MADRHGRNPQVAHRADTWTRDALPPRSGTPALRVGRARDWWPSERTRRRAGGATLPRVILRAPLSGLTSWAWPDSSAKLRLAPYRQLLWDETALSIGDVGLRVVAPWFGVDQGEPKQRAGRRNRRRVTLGFAGCLSAEPHDSEPSGVASLWVRGFGSRGTPTAQSNRGSSVRGPDRPLLVLSLALVPFRQRQAAMVITPQIKPHSSRATAVTASWGFFPLPMRRV
jgi:hypothetical protein